MRIFKSFFAALALVLAFGSAANAQSLDDDNTMACAGGEASAQAGKADVQEIEVWPKEASFKVMVDLEASETVKVLNIIGNVVKEQKLSKGEALDVESLIPGDYVVLVGDNKKGSFVKK